LLDYAVRTFTPKFTFRTFSGRAGSAPTANFPLVGESQFGDFAMNRAVGR
jgi:hypothetical protein